MINKIARPAIGGAKYIVVGNSLRRRQRALRAGDGLSLINGGPRSNVILAIDYADDLIFADGGGLVRGGISVVGNTNETIIEFANTEVKIAVFDTNAPSRNVTPNHRNDRIVISKAGDYLIIGSITLNSVGGAGSTAQIVVRRNSVLCGALRSGREIGAGGGIESGSMSVSDICTLSAGDVLTVWIKNKTNARNYVVENITLSVLQVGG